MATVDAALRARIAEAGPLPFSAVMDAALYDPDGGFYATVGRAGRRGDFITSPEVGPLFGAVVARALDTWWDELGEPDPFTVVEAGAGPGTLARTILTAGPRCQRALHYVLVERAASQRALHADLASRTTAVVETRATLPTRDGPCVVLANELLDNLPCDLYERTAEGWAELRVAVRDDRLVGVLVPTDLTELDALAPDAKEGARVPWQIGAQDWLRSALALAGGAGRVVAWDYATTTAGLAGRPVEEWMRTYRGHQRGGHPLEDLGSQDVTCEVAIDQLSLVRPLSGDTSQADWLRSHGIDGLVEEARRVWRERAAIGDLDAMKARSRVNEAEALLDPMGLGAFRVLEWGPVGQL
jgi:SAM-dependent MidA family methyltransferase